MSANSFQIGENTVRLHDGGNVTIEDPTYEPIFFSFEEIIELEELLKSHIDSRYDLIVEIEIKKSAHELWQKKVANSFNQKGATNAD